MKDIYNKLLRYRCIDKEEFKEKKSKIEDVLAMRAEYLNQLEQKNHDIKNIFRELHQEEVEIIEEIKELLNTHEFKSAYNSNKKNTKISKYLELLENDKIECTKGKKDLKEMREFIKDLIEKQSKIDDRKLDKIKKQVGSKIWDDFQHHFQSDEFLNFVNSN